MPVIERSTGVEPEVNLGNPLHTSSEAHKLEGINLRIETQGRRHHKSKNSGTSGPQKELSSSKNKIYVYNVLPVNQSL